jgi:Transposase IS116/IS110/IS902 family
VTASAVVATVGEFGQFKNGAQFGAWIGLVPRQHSSGGKSNLGGITKRGDTCLRSLLIQSAKSAVMTAHKRSDPISTKTRSNGSDRQRASSTNPWWLESVRCPRGWNGAPLSGSHLGPHTRPQRPCNKAVSREAVCSSSTLFASPCLSINGDPASRSSMTNTNSA